nr:unnamed protein product [Spirometra erinaceieuropaei]
MYLSTRDDPRQQIWTAQLIPFANDGDQMPKVQESPPCLDELCRASSAGVADDVHRVLHTEGESRHGDLRSIYRTISSPPRLDVMTKSRKPEAAEAAYGWHPHLGVPPPLDQDFQQHALQILAFARFIKTLSPTGPPPDCPYRLILVGGSRDDADAVRVEKLRELVEQLGLSDVVDFHVNAAWDTLGKLFQHSSINLHSMVDEHFGIAQGRLPAAAGEALPSKPTVGFLATTETEYARLFEYVLVRMNPAQRQAIGEAAAARASTMFSEAAFIRGWMGFLQCLQA